MFELPKMLITTMSSHQFFPYRTMSKLSNSMLQDLDLLWATAKNLCTVKDDFVLLEVPSKKKQKTFVRSSLKIPEFFKEKKLVTLSICLILITDGATKKKLWLTVYSSSSTVVMSFENLMRQITKYFSKSRKIILITFW